MLLELHAFEHGLDDDVCFAELVVGQRWLDAGQPLIHLLLGKAALLHRARVCLLDSFHGPVKGGLIGLLDQNWNARVGVAHGDATPHGAASDNGGPLDRNHRRFLADAGNLGDSTFAKKHVNERLRLIRMQTLGEELAFTFASFFEGHRQGSLDAVDGFERSQSPRAFFCTARTA